MNQIQLGLFDDHPIIADGIASYIAKFPQEISIAFIAHTKEEVFTNLNVQFPNVLVLDVVAPDVNGLDLFTDILKINPAAKLIAYTSLKSVILVENLLSIGVKGYVSKTQSTNDLLTAIKDVNNGLIYVPQKYTFLTSKYRASENTALTKREFEILLFISKELTTQEIADQLLVSPKTIENHKINIFKKLEVKNAAGLILAATRLGYIS
jgi:DNA-binding NarL/FixJ family response regulator